MIIQTCITAFIPGDRAAHTDRGTDVRLGEGPDRPEDSRNPVVAARQHDPRVPVQLGKGCGTDPWPVRGVGAWEAYG